MLPRIGEGAQGCTPPKASELTRAKAAQRTASPRNPVRGLASAHLAAEAGELPPQRRAVALQLRGAVVARRLHRGLRLALELRAAGLRGRRCG
jgi:hypothetical protein